MCTIADRHLTNIGTFSSSRALITIPFGIIILFILLLRNVMWYIYSIVSSHECNVIQRNLRLSSYASKHSICTDVWLARTLSVWIILPCRSLLSHFLTHKVSDLYILSAESRYNYILKTTASHTSMQRREIWPNNHLGHHGEWNVSVEKLFENPVQCRTIRCVPHKQNMTCLTTLIHHLFQKLNSIIFCRCFSLVAGVPCPIPVRQ